MKFENVSCWKSGRSIVIDFRFKNIHTGTYVRWSRAEADGLTERGDTTSHDLHALPAEFNKSDGARDGFSCF